MEICTKLNLKVIEKLNSEGSNSNLYLVEDPQLGTYFILKQIKKANFHNPLSYFTEAKKIYSTSHPNIVNIVHGSYDSEYIYITMPYYKRGSLNNILNNRCLTVREIIKYSLDFLSAVHYLHTKGLMHCDIKPTNILINDANKAILADFGSSRWLNDYGMANLRNVYYKHIAPEQCTTTNITTKVDIYQIGTTLYRMCNGNEEYDKQMSIYKNLDKLKLGIMYGQFPQRNMYLPHIPDKLRYIIEKSLAIRLDNRYDSVIEIINDLGSIEEDLDWEYNKIEEDHYIWYLKKNNIKIDMIKENNVWNIVTEQSDETLRSVKQTNYNHIPSKEEAYKVVKNIISSK
jgi:eukaryotic-like serine/threonine-protein kinase